MCILTQIREERLLLNQARCRCGGPCETSDECNEPRRRPLCEQRARSGRESTQLKRPGDVLGEADLRLGGELADRQHLGELRRRMFRWDMLSVAGIVLAGYNVCRHCAAVRSATGQHRGRGGE